jgi:hypothetical protein
MAPKAPNRRHLFKARLDDDEYRRLCNRQWEDFQRDDRARTNAGFLMLLVDRPGLISERERASKGKR